MTHAFRGVLGAPAIPVRSVVFSHAAAFRSESESELDVEWGAIN
jgi:hypothetical protein